MTESKYDITLITPEPPEGIYQGAKDDLEHSMQVAEMAQRLDETEAEVQRLYILIRNSAADMGRSLEALADQGLTETRDHMREMGRIEARLKYSIPKD